jgi:hypothetical protein
MESRFPTMMIMKQPSENKTIIDEEILNLMAEPIKIDIAIPRSPINEMNFLDYNSEMCL